ncbi:segregation and condensation protein A [Salinicola tamaricis]|uniref:segregation and condensation protein A n=1 Tax=Salinicola tamaricis TaxID=1771309 RepID=UPI000D0A6334|nr:ScpA family protein [Salinicola tamaricis]
MRVIDSEQEPDAAEAASPEQLPLDFVVRVNGETLTQLPEDLYIPPEALKVFLETFEGPLDLLLYLIRRHNLDILAINVAAITHQYVEYVELMQAMEIDLAGEYLVMAAMLAEIKSRSLLPRPPKAAEDDEEEDPRAELIRRLQEYEQLKLAAEELDALPRQGRDWHPAQAALPTLTPRVVHPDVELGELLGALGQMLKRADLRQSHRISREALSTRDRMQAIMQRLSADQFTPFEALFTPREGRAGVIVTFMAILELARESMIEIVQNAPLSPIHVRARLALEAGAEAAFDADDMAGAAADEPVFETDGVSDSGASSGRQQR